MPSSVFLVKGPKHFYDLLQNVLQALLALRAQPYPTHTFAELLTSQHLIIITKVEFEVSGSFAILI